MASLRAEIDAVEHRAVRTVELGGRAVVASVAVFVLIIGHLLPWMGTAAGWEVLLGQGDAAGKAGMVPRLFAATSVLFGIAASALTLITRRWGMAWIAALGGWFASVDGVLAIWTRQSTAGLTSPGPGIGLVISEIAMVVLAVLWFRTAWSRT
ncbi:Rv2732c family membrane protein [Actinokineospora sp.]|uniref:Rv2732c family membrane protein n=1 Tax=Actinokineospora sp. TaxID=1872133 RepID=UPI004037846E